MFLRRKNPSSERPRTGGILIRSEFYIKLVFSRYTRKYVGKKCTRMYTSRQAICKKANGERICRTASLFCGDMKNGLMRLSCASESVLRPKADNRFKAFDTEPLCEHIGLFFAALPLLIGIVVIGF